MEKDVSKLVNKIDSIYDDVPYHIKHYAELPMRFHDLTHDQRSFFDEFLTAGYIQLRSAVKEDHTILREMAQEMKQVCDTILEDNK